MPLLHHTSFTNSPLFNSPPPFTNSTAIFPLSSLSCLNSFTNFKFPKFRRTFLPLCAKNGVFEESKETLLPKRGESDEELEGLELLNKPSPKPVSNEEIEVEEEIELKKVDADEILAPFYKLFRPPEEEIDENGGEIEELGKVAVEYYEPKQGDFVVGVVVSGNENKLDVNVGADMLGTMLTKEVLPLYDKEMELLLCDVGEDAEEFLVRGKVGILRNDEVMGGGGSMPGKPVVDVGTVLFAEVLGRTLGGRPLLSTRKLFRRIAWHRVRQVLFFLMMQILELWFLVSMFVVVFVCDGIECEILLLMQLNLGNELGLVWKRKGWVLRWCVFIISSSLKKQWSLFLDNIVIELLKLRNCDNVVEQGNWYHV